MASVAVCAEGAVAEKLTPGVDAAALILMPVVTGMLPSNPPMRLTWMRGLVTRTGLPLPSTKLTTTLPMPVQVVAAGNVV